jgi:outer membrane scaffolding protein for murein synthesis (MipA/OmpV family)
LLGAAGLLLPVASTAADPVSDSALKELPLWELGIGAAAYNQPNYPGSDVRSTTGVPFPYVIYRGERFRIDRSIQGILFETQRLKIDISAGGNALVESDDSDVRRGPSASRPIDVRWPPPTVGPDAHRS